MRDVVTDTRSQIKIDEGLRLFPYTDSEGHLTIGYGTNLDAGISLEEADMLLEHRLEKATVEVDKHIPFAQFLDDARRGALLNMAYNLGIGRLREFKKMLAAMDKGEWEEAAKELLDSKYAKQVGARAQRLAKQIEKGRWI